MSHTPDIIISKPLKFLHDAFGFIGCAFMVITVFSNMQGDPWIGTALLSVISLIICCKIKFKWVKYREESRYRQV